MCQVWHYRYTDRASHHTTWRYLCRNKDIHDLCGDLSVIADILGNSNPLTIADIIETLIAIPVSYSNPETLFTNKQTVVGPFTLYLIMWQLSHNCTYLLSDNVLYIGIPKKLLSIKVVVVAKLTAWSLPIQESPGSNPVTSNFDWTIIFC